MKALQKRSKIEQVVDSIKSSIAGGDFKVGAKLPSEDSISNTLRVSRSTVREAFKVLQEKGYLELRPGRGAFAMNTRSKDTLMSNNGMSVIKRIPVTAQIAESIREAIVKGHFQIGDKLPPELKLCEMLKVSRPSIREAMQLLQAEGYVELLPGRGAFVRDNQNHDYDTVRRWFIASSPNLRDFTEIRRALESLAARMAIERGTALEYKELEKIHNNFVAAVRENNVSALASLDEKFHTQIALMSHNSLLSNINDILNSKLREYRIRSISVKTDSENTAREHAEILMGIKKRDASAAAAAMLSHLDMVLGDIQKVIDGPDDAADNPVIYI